MSKMSLEGLLLLLQLNNYYHILKKGKIYLNQFYLQSYY